ncbi:MAG: DUF551 domain-containing protein [Bacteroidaceae bacterium]|nr:DUF551 domain-containing protein [Bacteroidaceae bacterium]
MTGTLAATTEQSAAEVLQRYIDAYDMAIAALREQPRWISVEERLPEKNGRYLVIHKFYSYNLQGIFSWTDCYDGVEEHLRGRAMWYDYDSEYGDYATSGVTHWMPLPEPPEVET